MDNIYRIAVKYQSLLGGRVSKPCRGGVKDSIFNTLRSYFEKSEDVLKQLFNDTSDKDIMETVDTSLQDFSKNVFNDIIESLAYTFAIHRDEFEARHFDIRVYYLILKIYPYFVYNLMYNKTIEEQLDMVRQLDELDKSMNIHVAAYTTNMDKYKTYLNNYYSKYALNNVCINFNNFIGIQFAETYLPYECVPKDVLIVHVGFNNTVDNVIYKFYPGISTNFITHQDVLDFKHTEEVKTHAAKECWELFIDGVRQSVQLKDTSDAQIYIAICYDNEDKLSDCKYSLSAKSYTARDINVLTHGGIICNVSEQTMRLYMSKMFYDRRNRLVVQMGNHEQEETETQKLRAKFAKMIKECYSPDYTTAANNIAKEFPNEKYLRLYLEGLKNCCEETGLKLSFEKYYEFVKLYFFPTNF